MSTRSELESIARRWIGLWCVPVDWDAFDALHADDFEDCASAGRPADKKGFAEGLKRFTTAFPDLETRTEQLVVDERASTVAVRWSATGTNQDRYLGVGPTRTRTRITGIEIIQIRDGKLVRRWGEWDITDHAG